MKALRISPLLIAVFLSQLTHAVAATCTTELILAAVFGSVLALVLIILLAYCCIKRCLRRSRPPASTKSLVSSVEEGSRRFGNPSMDLSIADMELEERRREDQQRQICSQCHQRMIRANIETWPSSSHANCIFAQRTNSNVSGKLAIRDLNNSVT